ncbi:SEL1-like repeat protein [Legionella spiritensis]|uniref:SEL1-like repeat protein n=1 Tax=Legionella spiritensis TaxID=452 RepID=UPI000F6CFFF7|nr:SEL1-like repeat protein [Legionella spiritensis]VEG89680.1 TPR repeat protein [Legionella spiritensis]
MPRTKRKQHKSNLKINKINEDLLFLKLTRQLLDGDYTYYHLWLSLLKLFHSCRPDALEQWIKIAINGANQRIIETKCPNAMIFLAQLYSKGLFVDQDIEKAIALYEQAIESGHPVAMTHRAEMYYEGGLDGDDPYLFKTIALYERAIAKNEPDAMVNLAMIYEQGLDGRIDTGKAIALYKRAIELNHSGAMVRLARMYKNGIGVEEDIDKAIELYQRAVAMHDPVAMVKLARMYEAGTGVQPDKIKAIKLYLQASRFGNAQAMSDLAHIYYFSDEDCEIDVPLALELWDSAIKLGCSKAMVNRAYVYQQEMDITKAIELYQQAADLNNPLAITNLGGIYQQGLGGVEVDMAKAIGLYQQAADLNDPLAMTNLGDIYQEGLGGVEVDMTKAHEFYKQAAKLNDPFAMTALALIYQAGKNYPKAIRLFEKAIRLGEPENEHFTGSTADYIKKLIAALPDAKKIVVAKDLLDLIWEDLLVGTSFTDGTWQFLATFCKPDIMARLTDDQSPWGTSLAILRMVCADGHLIRKILDYRPESSSSESDVASTSVYSCVGHLLARRNSLKKQRLNFFRTADQLNSKSEIPVPLSKELWGYTLSFLHSGLEIDRQAWLCKNGREKGVKEEDATSLPEPDTHDFRCGG